MSSTTISTDEGQVTPLYFAERSQEAYEASTISEAGVECYLTLEVGWRCLAFRGTEFDFQDILRDIRGVPWYDHDLGWCHSGFLKGARIVWPGIAPHLMVDEPVYLTGHSLGGALATITGAVMAVGGKPPAGLVTFGAPRAGFLSIGKILSNVSSRRFVYGIDCIPSHPWPIWGYRHVGREVGLPLAENEEADRFLNHRMADYRSVLRTTL